MALAQAESKGGSIAASHKRLGEFDCVRLLVDIPQTAGVMWLYDEETAASIVAGSTGTIVHAHAEDGPFEVEFAKPVPALATVAKDKLAPL